jgi:hypothetical protein
MEILDLKLGGITICFLLGVFGFWYLGNKMLREWRDRRAFKKELDEMRKNDDTVWKPDMVSGVDHGRWVRKDGGSI